MSGIDFREDIAQQPNINNTWRGIVAKSAVDFTDRITVLIPDFAGDLKFGPCRWNPRDAVSLPAKGDACLVVFDNDYEPWIVMWWPFA